MIFTFHHFKNISLKSNDSSNTVLFHLVRSDKLILYYTSKKLNILSRLALSDQHITKDIQKLICTISVCDFHLSMDYSTLPIIASKRF